MASNNQQIFTSPETLAALGERAKVADDFMVKVLRKGNTGPIVVANLSGAQLSHFVNPELWVPQMCGGGKYNLQCFHSGATEQSEQGKQVGGLLSFDIGDSPREVDVSCADKPGWRGPAKLDFPTKIERPQQEQLLAYHSPPGPDASLSATSINQPWVRQPGGGISRQDYGNAATAASNEWRVGAQALEGERRKLEEEKLATERERSKERQEAANKAHEADMRALRAEFDAKLAASIASAKPSGPDPVITLMMEMMKSAAEDRRAAAAQAAEDRRAEAARQERADARFALTLEKLSDKPKENPLEMFKLLNDITSSNAKKNDGIVEAQAKMMHSMSDMMGQQVSVAMDFVSAAADMQLGQQGEKEPGWVKGLEGVVKAVGAMAKGAQVRPPIAPPAPQPMQTLPAQQAPQQKPPAPQATPTVIVQVEMAIRQKLPPAQIAKALIDNYMDDSVQQALVEAQGDIESYVNGRLGNWINEDAINNPAYLKALFAEIEKQFFAAGKIDEEEEEDAQVEESSNEGDEETP